MDEVNLTWANSSSFRGLQFNLLSIYIQYETIEYLSRMSRYNYIAEGIPNGLGLGNGCEGGGGGREDVACQIW